MTATKEHYDRHLGPVYSWMAGDFGALCARSESLFDRLGFKPRTHGDAIDLGCGHGGQAVPLARRGFRVLAIDFCRVLLEELKANAQGLPVTALEADLLDFKRHVVRPVDAIVCMGDTLTHLPSIAAVEQLISDAASVLVPGGAFLATFRDYVSSELRGEARFIPVKADDERILTCVLEYGPTTVTVYDLLHSKQEGRWVQQVSSYRKLRLDAGQVAEICTRAGLDVTESSVGAGLVTIAAVRG